MLDTPASPSSDLLQLTVQIVSAHVGHNDVAPDTLPTLIQSVYAALGSLGQAPAMSEAEAERPQPAVPVKKSVQPDYIVCLEDGAKLKMLKRYITTCYNMTPAQYRERWNLPADYPMVAPAYAERRSSLAKEFGLGRKRVEAEVSAPVKASRPRAKAAAPVID